MPPESSRHKGQNNDGISSDLYGDYDVYDARGSMDRRELRHPSEMTADANTLSPKEVRKKALGKTRRSKFRVNAAVAVMTAVFVLLIGICVIFAAVNRNPGQSGNASGNTAEAIKPLDPPSTGATLTDGFKKITVQNEQMHEGDLILVNYAYAYSFPEDNDICSVYNYKTKSYKVSNTSTEMSRAVTEKFNKVMDDFYENTGCADMLLVSGYRDFESQQRIYKDRVETQGEEMAAKYVATPGYSEHHTGLCMDLSVYLSDGTTHYVEDYPLCDWFEEHAAEYGFVLRYPEVKADITRISYESWHYRYVGTPHALIMKERDLCLEEYTEFLRNFRYGEKYLIFSDSGTSSESDVFPESAEAVIYYMTSSSGDTTEICVPETCEYTVSGNNVDGFIITAYPEK